MVLPSGTVKSTLSSAMIRSDWSFSPSSSRGTGVEERIQGIRLWRAFLLCVPNSLETLLRRIVAKECALSGRYAHAEENFVPRGLPLRGKRMRLRQRPLNRHGERSDIVPGKRVMGE